MRKILALTLLFLFCQPSFASFYFGRGESLYFVQDISIKGPQGEELQLSRLVVRNSLLLPYTVSSGGLVLTVRGVRDSYFPFPDGPIVQQYQIAGLLPDPLPSAELTNIDLIIGYSLWEALFALLAWNGIKRVLRRKEPESETA